MLGVSTFRDDPFSSVVSMIRYSRRPYPWRVCCPHSCAMVQLTVNGSPALIKRP